MGQIRDAANSTYSDGPSSNPDKPQKSLIRWLFGLIEDTIQSSLEDFDVNYETRAELYADLNWPADSLARVFGDSNEAYRGVYQKSGSSGSGSWTQIGPLPGGDTTALQAQVDAIEDEVDGKLNANAMATAAIKDPVVDADVAVILDSAASNALKRLTFASIKAWIKAWIVKADVGLDRVDNTADIDKDLSLRVQSAIAERGHSPRDTLSQDMAWSIVDAVGRAVGIDLDGYLRASGTRVYSPDDRDNASPYVWAVTDAERRVAMGITASGEMMAAATRIPVPSNDRDTGGLNIPVWLDAAGKMLIGVDPAGHALVAPGIATYRDPASIAGGYPVMNVRMGPEHMIGTVQLEGGYLCDVAQLLVGNTYNAAVAIEAEPVKAILVVGQSNAGAGSGPTGTLPILEPIVPHHAFVMQTYSAYGDVNRTTTLNGYSDLQAAQSFGGQAYAPGIAMCDALAEIDIAAWRRATAYVSFTAWEGSQPLSSFLPATAGHFNHANALAGVRAMKRVGEKYRETEMSAMLFIQGENGSAGYAASLGDYIDDVVPLYAAEAGLSEVPFFFRQINLAQNASAADTFNVAQDQLAVARARLGAGVTMTGPMYHLPLHDTIHADNVGRLIGGEMDAVAYRSAIELGEDFHPLWPVAGGVTRSGATITVPMSLPPGLPASALKIDADWVASVPNAGFVYSDASSGATITNVAISGADIVITLSANPGAAASKLLSYAIYNAAPVVGWAGGRGLIYADTGIESPAYRKGLAVPETIRHYCARFQETLA